LRHFQRAQFAVAVYGIISLAVVVVAWEPGGKPWELALLAAGYAVAIWLAHSFADVVSGGPDTTWRAALVEEEPVMVGAVPVVVIALVGQLLGWEPAVVELLDLLSLVALLVVVQIFLVRTASPDRRRVGGTLIVDVLVFLLIVVLLVAVH
jgi:hypothetical protein